MKNARKIIDFINKKNEEKKSYISGRLNDLKRDIEYLVNKNGKGKTEKMLRKSFVDQNNAILKGCIEYMNTIQDPEPRVRKR